jgi:hypothetical protein
LAHPIPISGGSNLMLLGQVVNYSERSGTTVPGPILLQDSDESINRATRFRHRLASLKTNQETRSESAAE